MHYRIDYYTTLKGTKTNLILHIFKTPISIFNLDSLTIKSLLYIIHLDWFVDQKKVMVLLRYLKRNREYDRATLEKIDQIVTLRILSAPETLLLSSAFVILIVFLCLLRIYMYRF